MRNIERQILTQIIDEDMEVLNNYYAAKTQLKRLHDALVKFGEHRKDCHISASNPCDCGLDDAIKESES